MSSETIQQFESSLDEIDIVRSRTIPEAFQQELERTVRGPAVGVSIPIDGVSLGETPVATDPTPEELKNAKTGVSPAETGVASYGSLVIKHTPDGAESVSLFPIST